MPVTEKTYSNTSRYYCISQKCLCRLFILIWNIDNALYSSWNLELFFANESSMSFCLSFFFVEVAFQVELHIRMYFNERGIKFAIDFKWDKNFLAHLWKLKGQSYIPSMITILHSFHDYRVKYHPRSLMVNDGGELNKGRYGVTISTRRLLIRQVNTTNSSSLWDISQQKYLSEWYITTKTVTLKSVIWDIHGWDPGDKNVMHNLLSI